MIEQILMRMRRPRAVRLAAGGTMLLVAIITGCAEDDDCPVCPAGTFQIEQIQFFPTEAPTVGDTLHMWATGRGGGDLRFNWSTTHGRFLEIDGNYAQWKAPDTPVLATLTVVAFTDEESDTRSSQVTVSAYRPRHEPTYAGAGYCLECHDSANHGLYYDAWVQSPHARALGAVGAASTAGDCAACHAVGYGDVDGRGWARHNGGFDEVPIAELQGVQCENCHGPLADVNGEIRADHGELARGDFLLTSCRKCHTDEEVEEAADLHAPQVQMLAGEGGHTYGTFLPSTPHEEQVPRDCVTCHYPVSEIGGSHTFAADPLSCVACHEEANGGNFDWSDAMNEVEGLLTALKVELAQATEEDRQLASYENALLNLTFVERDGSFGAHNYAYARELLWLSLLDFQPSGR